jgi:SAM-dependent methyltransferase
VLDATLARSVRLFRAFLREQTDPDHFYRILAEDSVRQTNSYAPLDGATVLDVGGGPGYFSAAFRQAGARYVGVDPDVGELSARGTPVPGMLRASGTALPIRTGSVDLCYSSNVLEHVADPTAMLDEMVRVTRPGGTVFVSFTPWYSPWGGHETSPWHYLGGHYARRRFTRRTGRQPKNRYGESLFPITAGKALRWAATCDSATLIRALPRYHPRWATWIIHVPLLREIASWNVVLVLRKKDPFGGRQPTSHERMTGRPWDASYHDGPAPWDVGHPQPAVTRLVAARAFTGTVLDAGCGTGENTLHIASAGLPVLGVDVAETALAMARAKADDRGIKAEFEAADAFQLHRLHRTFDTVLDCGLFHTCDAEERARYVASLASVTEPGGTLYVLCLSDQGPGTGPHPVSRDDLEAAFNPDTGWTVAAIEPDRVHTRFHDGGAPAWLATIKRR